MSTLIPLRSAYDPSPPLGQNELGHTSKAVTERHYINRKLVVPDCRAATERLAPPTGSGDGPALGV